jgi:hypothetical protein
MGQFLEVRTFLVAEPRILLSIKKKCDYSSISYKHLKIIKMSHNSGEIVFGKEIFITIKKLNPNHYYDIDSKVILFFIVGNRKRSIWYCFQGKSSRN